MNARETALVVVAAALLYAVIAYADTLPQHKPAVRCTDFTVETSK